MMKKAQPKGLSQRRVERLLAETRNGAGAGNRIEVLSRRLLGYPYQTDPLIGSADTAEVFTASLDRFDCVTYIETIVALARAGSADEFTDWLRKIRYENGRIQWQRRNHYMTQWIRNNVARRIIKPISSPSLPTMRRERVLNVVPGLGARRARIEYVPKRAAARLRPHLRSGDLVFFVSTRRNLDVFHAGIIVHEGGRILMRHASRSHGLVVEQELGEFLKANRMAGVIVMRPQGLRRREGM